MQEMFTKDLEELKHKKQMNNTLEEINSRTTEAEEWINELEDRMMEITATEQNIEKRMKKKKKKEDSITRPLGQHTTHQHLHHRGPRRRRERERTGENT